MLILKTRARIGFKGNSSGKIKFDPRRLCYFRLLWFSTMAHRLVAYAGRRQPMENRLVMIDEEPHP